MASKRRSPIAADEFRREVLQALREAVKKYGEEAAPKIVREKYPNTMVSKATWYRWLAEVQIHPKQVNARDSIKLAKSLPAAPPAAYISDKPTEARKNINLLTRLEDLYSDAEMLRAHSVTQKEDREVIRLPSFFAQSIKLRSDLLDNALAAMAQVWDLKRMQDLYELVMREVGKADPETQKRIIEGLRELNLGSGVSLEDVVSSD